MSEERENPYNSYARPVRPFVHRFMLRTVDEIAQEVRYCDSCGEAQLFNNVGGLRVNYNYYELCLKCILNLRLSIDKSLGISE